MEINRRLMVLMDLPVTKPERLYQCGTWSTVYPPLHTKTEKENKDARCKKDTRRRWEFGVQYEPWET